MKNYTKVDVILMISEDIMANPNSYSDQVLNELSILSKELTKEDISGELAYQYYTGIINPSIHNVTNYWNDNYISKPIYKSLVKFYNNNLSNIELLIMITSIINRSLIAIREDSELDATKLGIGKLSMILGRLIKCDINSDYPEDLISELKIHCTKLGLFKSIIDKEDSK